MSMSKTLSTMRFMVMGVAALLAIAAPMVARAQITSTTVTDVPLTSSEPVEISTTPSPTPAPTTWIGTMTVECWRTTLLSGEPASFPVDTAAASTVSGAVCYEVYSDDGGIARVPVTPGPNFEPLSIQSSISAAAAASATAERSTSWSSTHLIRVLLPALIGSLIGVFLLVFATLYFLRLRTRRKTQNSRARHWIDRNSTSVSESWVMKEAPSSYGRKPEAA